VSSTRAPAAADGAVARRRGVGLRGDLLAVLTGYVVAGVAGGVLWWLLAPTPTFVKLRSGGAMDEVQLSREFGIVGWYLVLGVVLGFVLGAALTWWRDRDPLLTSGLLLLGSAVAAALAALLGHQLGPADPATVLGAVRVGAHVPDQLHVAGAVWPAFLGWPVGSLAGAFVVLLAGISDETAGDSPGWPSAP
jgi:hypothetical protein